MRTREGRIAGSGTSYDRMDDEYHPNPAIPGRVNRGGCRLPHKKEEWESLSSEIRYTTVEELKKRGEWKYD